MAKALKARLLEYMMRHHTDWFASGFLQRLVANKTTYTPRTVVRRLEELAEAGVLEVEYRDKNHAWYRYKTQPLYQKPEKPPETETLFKNEKQKKNVPDKTPTDQVGGDVIPGAV